MSDFEVQQETPRAPYGMILVGSGVIISCLVLCVLFGWGIYLDLSKEDCYAASTELVVLQSDLHS